MRYLLLLSAALFLVTPAARAEDALTMAEKAYESAWESAPLTIARAILVSGPAQGYGIYTERPAGPYKPGEKVLIYSEPKGFGYRDNGDGTVTFGFSLDLSVTGPDGAEVFSQADWQHVELTSKERNREFMLTIDLDFGATPPPPGDYKLNFLVHDMNSSESAPISLPVTLAE